MRALSRSAGFVCGAVLPLALLGALLAGAFADDSNDDAIEVVAANIFDKPVAVSATSGANKFLVRYKHGAATGSASAPERECQAKVTIRRAGTGPGSDKERSLQPIKNHRKVAASGPIKELEFFVPDRFFNGKWLATIQLERVDTTNDKEWKAQRKYLFVDGEVPIGLNPDPPSLRVKAPKGAQRQPFYITGVATGVPTPFITAQMVCEDAGMPTMLAVQRAGNDFTLQVTGGMPGNACMICITATNPESGESTTVCVCVEIAP